MIDWSGYPAWVSVDGKPHRVSEYRGLLPDNRPVAYCLECKREVVLKIGDERVHHFAHKSDEGSYRCRLNNPAAARHLNAMYHLVAQLDPTQCRELKIFSYRSEPSVLARDWDQVVTEYTIGNRRADVALLRDGKPIAIIEVFASHEVDLDKNDDLDKTGIPWIEVNIVDLETLDVEGGQDFAWTATLPLHVRQGTPYNNRALMFRINGTPASEPDQPVSMPGAEKQASLLPPRMPKRDAVYRHYARRFLSIALKNQMPLQIRELDLPWKEGGLRVFAQDWDSLELGKIIGPVRVDLAFSRNGVDIAYLMLYAGEPMWEYPRYVLDRTGVPWVEVDMMASLWPSGDADGEPTWAPDQPLIVRPSPDESRPLPQSDSELARLARFKAARDHLVQQLRPASTLAIALPSSPAYELAPRVLAHDWDEVCTDFDIDGLTVAIALLRKGQPILFIEILAGYRFDHKHLQDLDQLGLHWIEVAAADILGAEGRPETAWTPDQRLMIRAGSPVRERNEHPRAGQDWTRWPSFDFRWLSGDFDPRDSRRQRGDVKSKSV